MVFNRKHGADKPKGNVTPSSDNTEQESSRQPFKMPEQEQDEKNLTFADNVKFSIDTKRAAKMKHSPSFYNERKSAVEVFRGKVEDTKKKQPHNNSINEYKNKIFERLDYIRHKRRSYATNEHQPGDEMFKNVIGTAVGYKEALTINQSSAK